MVLLKEKLYIKSMPLHAHPPALSGHHVLITKPYLSVSYYILYLIIYLAAVELFK